MSVETLAIVVSAIGITLSLGASIFASCAWIVRRMDAMEERLITRIDGRTERLCARIDRLTGEVTEVKLAIARLEGPPRQLYVAGR